MNKYKEAFVTLTDWFHSYTDSNGVKVHERHITESYEEAKKKIGELVEKATPKKPIDIEDGFGDDVHLCCPNCKKPIANVWSSAKYMPNYCHFCGQALDWSEEE